MDEFDIQPITKSTPITKWCESRHEDEAPFDPEEKTRFQSLLGALSHLVRVRPCLPCSTLPRLLVIHVKDTTKLWSGWLNIWQPTLNGVYTSPQMLLFGSFIVIATGLAAQQHADPRKDMWSNSWAGPLSPYPDDNEMWQSPHVRQNIAPCLTVLQTLYGSKI